MQLNRRLALTGAICLVAIAVIVVLVLPEHASGVATAKPPGVEVAEVEQKDVALYSEWIGTLEGYVNADVRAQVTGYLLRQDCKEGHWSGRAAAVRNRSATISSGSGSGTGAIGAGQSAARQCRSRPTQDSARCRALHSAGQGTTAGSRIYWTMVSVDTLAIALDE